MSKSFLYIQILIAFLFVAGAQAQTANLDSVQVTVVISDVRSADGMVYLSVFDDAQAFPQDAGRAVKTARAKAKNGSVTMTMSGLPPGTYAFSTFHDENSNGKLDTGSFGIPKEGFGFSNNPPIRFGAPTFDQSKVVLQNPNERLSIQLNHF